MSLSPGPTALRALGVTGPPLVLALVELFHPPTLAGSQAAGRAWLAIHVVQLPLFALVGLSAFVILQGVRSPWATLSRIALAVYVPFYLSLDSVAGISAGILTVSGQHEAAGTLFASPVKGVLASIGTSAWIIALVAAAVALWLAGAPKAPAVLLAVSAVPLWFDHAYPFGPLAYGTFLVAAVWLGARVPAGPATAPDRAPSTRR